MNLSAGVRRLRSVLDPTRWSILEDTTNSGAEPGPDNLLLARRAEEGMRIREVLLALGGSPEALDRLDPRSSAAPPELPSRLATYTVPGRPAQAGARPGVGADSNGSRAPADATPPEAGSGPSKAAFDPTLHAARNDGRRRSRLRLRRTESPTETQNVVGPGLTESFMRMMF
jgi:hypothetical protein